MTTRVGIYARLSRDTETSTSIERQRAACEDEAARRGWTVVTVAEDVDVSGSKVAPWDRPGFAELLARRDVDVIIAYRIDRVARSVADFAALLARLKEADVALVSATEPFDLTNPLGEVLLYLVAIFAQMEARAIGDRVASSIARLRRSTRWSHGRAPYGYRIVPALDGPGKTLAVDPPQADVIREAARRVLDGESVYSVARDLNARGIAPLLATEWSVTVLRQTLMSDHLLGRVRHRGALVRDDSGEPLAPFPPLVDLETFEALQAVLAPRTRAEGPRQRNGARLLSGRLSCSSCGGPLTVSTSQGRQSYRCSAKSRGALCERPCSVLAEWAEEFVEREFLAAYGRLQVTERVETTTAPVGLADLDAQIRETTRALADAPTEAEEAEALRLLRRLKARRAEVLASGSGPVVEFRPTGRTFAQVWAASDLDARRDLLAVAIPERITVRPGRRGASALADDRFVLPWAP